MSSDMKFSRFRLQPPGGLTNQKVYKLIARDMYTASIARTLQLRGLQSINRYQRHPRVSSPTDALNGKLKTSKYWTCIEKNFVVLTTNKSQPTYQNY